MKIDRSQSKILQDITNKVFKEITGIDGADVAKGRTKDIKIIFTRVSEDLGIRNESMFADVAAVYEKYLVWRARNWWTWDGATASNFIGTMNNKDNVAVFIAKYLNPVAKKPEAVKKDRMAGKQTEDTWDF